MKSPVVERELQAGGPACAKAGQPAESVHTRRKSGK